MSLRTLTLAKTGIRNFPPGIRSQMLNFATAAVNEPCKMKDEVILKSLEAGKGLITLNRPKQLNTLNAEMVSKMRSELLRWKDNKYFIAIEGSGEKAFCAGGDVVAVVKDKTGVTGKYFFTEEYKLDALIASLKIPVIAFLGGIVMGGGVGVSIFGKYRVATEKSMFAMPETQIGFFPDVGVSHRLARMPNRLGYFLGLTGYRLKGYDLVHAGVATHFCTQERIKDLKHSLLFDFTKSLCSCPEEILNEFQESSLTSLNNGKPPKFSLEEHLPTINRCFAPTNVEDICKKIAEGKSSFATEILDYMKKMSPLSLKVTLKQISCAADMDLNEVFNMDYRVAMKMLESGDFSEGVRALLIDKDKRPKWKHADLSKVSDNEVNGFFAKLPENEELDLPSSLYKPTKVEVKS